MPFDRKPIDYAPAQAAQRLLVAARRQGDLPDLLWLLEHPPTITWGSGGGRQHLLRGEEELRSAGVALCPSERGGDVTWHEPGQLVGYPIVDLRDPSERDLHAYLRALESGLMSFLGGLGIAAGRVAGRTGVWIAGSPPRKIAALGVRAQGWVTSHGFALNVENALAGARWIVPCGIADAPVTSLARELGERPLPGWSEVCSGLHRALESALARPLRVLLGAAGMAAATAAQGSRAGA